MVDLENFPTSESAKRMMSTISEGFYERSYVGKWIFQVMGLEWDEARHFVEQLKDQAFPETATWGLRYHEEKYGLPIREGMPLEERRKYIYEKRDDRSPMNPARLEAILERLTGKDVTVDDQSGPPYTFTVTVESDGGDIDVGEVVDKVKKLKPSHTSFTARFAKAVHLAVYRRTALYSVPYVLCGTVPGTSTGLRLHGGHITICPDGNGIPTGYPMSGASGEAGMWPATSTGLKMSANTVALEPARKEYGMTAPVAGGSGDAGTYPGVSTGLNYAKAGIEADVDQEAFLVQSAYSGETEAGTIPKVSTGMESADSGMCPEVSTERWETTYTLCGSAFEI